MGRPALLGSRSRGPQYRGVRRPPHYGNRPWKRNSNQNARHKAKTPKGGARLLAGPLLPQQPSRQDTNKMALHQGRKHPRQEQPMRAQMIQTTTLLVDRCPGGAAWRRPGPKTPLLQKEHDFCLEDSQRIESQSLAMDIHTFRSQCCFL